MTEESKNVLLKFITGNLEKQNGNNVPTFGDMKQRTNNLYAYFMNQFSNGWFLTGIFSNQDINLIYGWYYDNEEKNGFIIMLDGKYNPIKTFKNFDTGTKLRPFEKLNVGDDGYYFGIDSDNIADSNANKRFLMLNNFTKKASSSDDYRVVLRTSYYLPDNIKKASNYCNVEKAPGQSSYLISGVITDTNFHDQPIATVLKVNVGSENEWIDYRCSLDCNFKCCDTIVTWDSDNVTFKLVGVDYRDQSNTKYVEYIRENDGLKEVLFASNFGLLNSIDVKVIGFQISYIFVYNSKVVNNVDYDVFEIYKAEYGENFGVTKIYSKESVMMQGRSACNIYAFRNNHNIYFQIVYSDSPTVSPNYLFMIGKLVNDQIYTKELGKHEITNTIGENVFSVQEQWNLTTYFSQLSNEVIYVNQIYNEVNYNGHSYININALVPKFITLYNSGDPIFSRNLYNKVINGNVLTSTVQIPENFLNDVPVTIQELIGETNLVLNKGVTTIEKNVYENTLLNFINVLTVQDKNNVSDPKVNQQASNLLVSNVDQSNYEDTKIGKVKIIYIDNSVEIINVNPNNITYVENSATIKVVMSLKKEVGNNKKIKILSDDESIEYCEIDVSGLETNKLYKLIQKVEVA